MAVAPLLTQAFSPLISQPSSHSSARVVIPLPPGGSVRRNAPTETPSIIAGSTRCRSAGLAFRAMLPARLLCTTNEKAEAKQCAARVCMTAAIALAESADPPRLAGTSRRHRPCPAAALNTSSGIRPSFSQASAFGPMTFSPNSAARWTIDCSCADSSRIMASTLGFEES